MYQANPSPVFSLFPMPEWNLALGFLAVLSILGLIWSPLLWALPFLMVSLGGATFLASRNAHNGTFAIPKTSPGRIRSILVTAGLHLVQPLARLTGRICSGLTPWRQHVSERFIFPWTRTMTAWSEEWLGLSERLEFIERSLQAQRILVQRGGDYDRWDLHIKAGLFGGIRARMAIEEHGGGKQLVCCRVWPRVSLAAMTSVGAFGLLSTWAYLDQAWIVGTILGGISLLLGLRMHQEYSFATLMFQDTLSHEPIIQKSEEPGGVEENILLAHPAPVLD
jgi:O-antigen biosynthesis protein